MRPIACVVLDAGFPATAGADAVRRVRARAGATPIVLVTDDPSLDLAVVMKKRYNGLELGQALAAERKAISSGLPTGIEFNLVADQSRADRFTYSFRNACCARLIKVPTDAGFNSRAAASSA
jgi:hypothetical protein